MRDVRGHISDEEDSFKSYVSALKLFSEIMNAEVKIGSQETEALGQGFYLYTQLWDASVVSWEGRSHIIRLRRDETWLEHFLLLRVPDHSGRSYRGMCVLSSLCQAGLPSASFTECQSFGA